MPHAVSLAAAVVADSVEPDAKPQADVIEEAAQVEAPAPLKKRKGRAKKESAEQIKLEDFGTEPAASPIMVK